MKKMSDVFELPVNYAVVVRYTVDLTKDETIALQNAINNVDALADALEFALSVLAHCKADAGYSSRQTKAAVFGNDTLKAYRGEK